MELAIDSAERKARNDTVRALLSALDLNAPGERAHAERVSVYALETGSRLGFSEVEMLRLRYASVLHDVGKTKLDSQVLSKVGKLTDEEMDVIKRHAEMSVRLVQSYEFLQPAIQGIQSHHERWNGSGYPFGLKGDEIPMAAQIIGLCEAFDVMVHGASWKSPTNRVIAIEELEDEAGTYWNPVVVEAFLDSEVLIQPVGSL
jgi:putative nucleotidyltransferase with HDIG domain